MARKSKNIHSKRPYMFWMFLSATCITLVINPKIADPFNAPKLYLLMISSSVLLSYLIFQTTPNKINSKLKYSVLFFMFILLIQVLFAKSIYYAVFGESQRLLGLLTYLGFAIYMLSSAKFFTYESKRLLTNSILFLSFFFSTYGLFQYFEKDPFKWVNPYSPVIVTLGNPNFSAAFMAMLGIICIGLVFDKELSKFYQYFFGLLSLTLFLCIYLSNARQGLVTLISGCGILIILIIYKTHKKMSFIIFSFFTLFGGLVVAGMLQVGPLEKYLYKESVSLRGYYWRAGIEMFKDNVFTGVGIERYGMNFKSYRELAYPLKYGFELISTNAHNVPIQFFATGGIFYGGAYLFLNIVILKIAINGIRILSGQSYLLLVTLFAAWIGFHLQAIVSIDNIGLTLWGWILGGSIVGLVNSSIRNDEAEKNFNHNVKSNQTNQQTLRVLLAGVLILFSSLFSIRLSQPESLIFQSRNAISSAETLNNFDLETTLNLILNDSFANPQYKIEAADYFYQTGNKSKGISAAQKAIDSDPGNPIFYGALAVMYEASSQYQDALQTRIKLISFDPYNAKNFLQIARLYKQLGDNQNALLYRDKIIDFAPKTEAAEIAKKEFP